MRTTASRRLERERFRCVSLGSCFIVALGISRLHAAADLGTAQLQPIYQWIDTRGFERHGDMHALKAAQSDRAAARASFFALTAEEWPAGLVPVFEVEGTNGFELRRLPPVGRENNTEPLFLALPLHDEPDTTRIAGRWSCTATRPSGSDAWFAWDLSALGDRVAGRFDPQSEFRVARLAGGAFRTNQIDLVIEYVGESYALTGAWRDGMMRGQWHREDDSESGTWQATRPPEFIRACRASKPCRSTNGATLSMVPAAIQSRPTLPAPDGSARRARSAGFGNPLLPSRLSSEADQEIRLQKTEHRLLTH